MVSLADLLGYMYPNAVFGTLADASKDVVISDDGSGQKVVYWNAATLGAQPEAATLQANAAATQAAISAKAAQLQNAVSMLKQYAASAPVAQGQPGYGQDQFNRAVLVILKNIAQQLN